MCIRDRVISVGTATIAAAVGAGGLGTLIFRGLRMNDNSLILQGAVPDDKTRDLTGQIAAARATIAGVRNRPEAVIPQARRALEYLHPDNLPSRCRANWTMGMAYWSTPAYRAWSW